MHQTTTGTCGEQITLHPRHNDLPPLPCALPARHDGRHEAKRADGAVLVWWYGLNATYRVL